MAHVGGGEYRQMDEARTGMPRGPRGTAGTLGRRARPARQEREEVVEEAAPDGAELDWARLAVFGAGIALGAVLGVGVTMFTTPVSGHDARRAVRRGARRALWRGQDAWEDLRDEFSAATLRRKKALRRRRRRAQELFYAARGREFAGR